MGTDMNGNSHRAMTETERARLTEKRRRQQRARARKRRARRVRCTFILMLALILLGGGILYYVMHQNPVVEEVTVEAGTEGLKPEQFVQDADKVKKEIRFVTDMGTIDFQHVGEYEIVLGIGDKSYTSKLKIVDTNAPAADNCPVTIGTDVKLTPEQLVTNIKDATDVTCSFKKEPDLSKEGKIQATVVLTDEGGNTTEVTTEITLVNDDEAPVINGVGPITAFIGEPIAYKKNVTVTDNFDKKVKLEIDNSQVDTEKAGTYPITYRATDQCGNTTEESTTITMQEKPDHYVDEDTVNELADAVLAEITTEDMTKKQKAKAIYRWTKSNIGYVNTSEKDSWTNGAYQGFTQKSGDCFIYFSTSKALLNRAGIPNIDIVKSDTSHSRHYWSLVDVGDGWYHFDATPRKGGGEFFLLTDEEILAYSVKHKNSHIFDESLYPATPTTDSTID